MRMQILNARARACFVHTQQVPTCFADDGFMFEAYSRFPNDARLAPSSRGGGGIFGSSGNTAALNGCRGACDSDAAGSAGTEVSVPGGAERCALGRAERCTPICVFCITGASGSSAAGGGATGVLRKDAGCVSSVVCVRVCVCVCV